MSQSSGLAVSAGVGRKWQWKKEGEPLLSRSPGSKNICKCSCNRVNTSHSQGTSSLFSLHPLPPPLPFLWRPHCSLPSAKVGEFPWQPGSWCLDTVKDALQWSFEPDSPRHSLPADSPPPRTLSICPTTPSLSIYCTHGCRCRVRFPMVVLVEETCRAGGEGGEIPKPLASSA